MNDRNHTKSNIYKITNKINGLVYVGKSIHPNKRWRQHKLLAKQGKGTKFYNDVRIFGIDSFIFEVIETDIPIKFIDEREIFYIKEYKCVETGYNISPGGGGDWFTNHPRKEEIRKKQSECKIKNHYRIISPWNEEFLVSNLNDFCTSFDLDRTEMHRVCLGGRSFFKGWVAFIIGKEYLRKDVERVLINGKYKAVMPDGISFPIHNIKYFCKLYEFHYCGVQRVYKGEAYSYKGWKFYKNGYENLRVDIEKRRESPEPKYLISNDKGEEFLVINMRDFCEQHSLSVTGMHYVVNGTFLQLKGWTGYTIGKEHLRDKIKLKNDEMKYEVSNLEGDNLKINNLASFCKSAGLNYNGARAAIDKNRYCGWLFRRIKSDKNENSLVLNSSEI